MANNEASVTTVAPDGPEETADFLRRYPETRAIDCFFPDLSGVVRGKRYPVGELSKIMERGLAFPGSVFLLDTMGESHDPAGRGFSDGDPDYPAVAVPGTLKPVPWLEQPTAQVLLTLLEPNGTPYRFEPRNVLRRVLEPFHALRLRPVVAFELEFYLIDRERGPGGAPLPPRSPMTGTRDHGTQVYGMAEVDVWADLLEEIQRNCRLQDIPTGALSAEYAPGQFEINLQHVDDPVLAADHCAFFKRAVKGTARRHGLQASFMAKPYLEEAGSGLHLHISLLDESGRNVFDGGPADPASETLRHAIGGILETLPEAMAFLAPNPNSYRRFTPNIFVPINRSWAFENRSTALRIPLGEGPARRIEHRVAGADANPYLVLATALAGIHHGVTNKLDPGLPTEGNAGTAFDETLPFRAHRAFERLANAPVLSTAFGADYLEAYAACKQAELERYEAAITSREYAWYLQPD